jgi:hypothetical protein
MVEVNVILNTTEQRLVKGDVCTTYLIHGNQLYGLTCRLKNHALATPASYFVHS